MKLFWNKILILAAFLKFWICICNADQMIFPGTKWCGKGNVAATTDNLGIYQGPDLCCRSHDLCPVKIHAFKRKYGLFNPRPHTSLHCSCDEAFRSCLKIDGSEKSRLVGEFYFNHLKAPCFTLEKGQGCQKRTWWGKCTQSDDVALHGKWRSSLHY